MNIGVIGCGYVGLTLATILACKQKVSVWDINKDRINQILLGKMPLQDVDLEKQFNSHYENIIYYDKYEDFIDNNKVFYICVPTDWSENRKSLDTSNVDKILEDIINRDCDKNKAIIIKSTLPVNYVKLSRQRFSYENIFYCPEFLREGSAFYDSIYSSKFVVGGEYSKLYEIIDEYLRIIFGLSGVKIIPAYVSTTEAEIIKLASNAYLAQRVAFFNEIDSISENNDADSKVVIENICKDPRIGNYYNNPSMGFGGYCLPKDLQELAYNPQINNLFKAVHYSNENRKQAICNRFLGNNEIIGIYRLNMKSNSDNMRGSAMVDIVNKLIEGGKTIYIYEPICEKIIDNSNVIYVATLEELASNVDIIIANRFADELNQFADKVYTRDIFRRD